ncbi:hypothetical protein EVAR_15134_1 [Eumeta japonica]|uniref:Uncharacterized protein n=1 Tax=Eumeta variegata TaxID=151549 RepID=A0A4C1UIY2_EUMVA|nr:hypothetical protein EVAR_15134_1 [Eumeta japonica]
MEEAYHFFVMLRFPAVNFNDKSRQEIDNESCARVQRWSNELVATTTRTKNLELKHGGIMSRRCGDATADLDIHHQPARGYPSSHCIVAELTLLCLAAQSDIGKWSKKGVGVRSGVRATREGGGRSCHGYGATLRGEKTGKNCGAEWTVIFYGIVHFFPAPPRAATPAVSAKAAASTG